MEPITQQQEGPSAGRQSKSRERPGYSWARITGLPEEVKGELDAIKTGLGFSYRDDVVSAILGEVGHLGAQLVGEGVRLILMRDEGGCTFRALLPDSLIEAIRGASTRLSLSEHKVAASILMAVRPRFRELARQGLMRRLDGEGAAA